MHDLGMNHRDYYLCHFLLDKSFAIHNEITDDTSLFLIDLHRAQLRKTVPTRWKIKDLAGLYFSAMDVPLSERDLYLFIFYYSGGKLKSSLSLNKNFWQQVSFRAHKLAQKHHA
jgi:heptose I phosphotransferase